MASASFPDASIAVLETAAGFKRWEHLRDEVKRLRRALPTVPVVLLMRDHSADAVILAHRAAKLRLRTVLPAAVPIYEHLRDTLTQPVNLADDVVEWLSVRRVHLAPRCAYIVRQIVAQSQDYPTLAALLEEIREPETSTRAPGRRRAKLRRRPL